MRNVFDKTKRKKSSTKKLTMVKRGEREKEKKEKKRDDLWTSYRGLDPSYGSDVSGFFEKLPLATDSGDISTFFPSYPMYKSSAFYTLGLRYYSRSFPLFSPQMLPAGPATIFLTDKTKEVSQCYFLVRCYY